MKGEKGFTLVEMLVVIGIILIIVGASAAGLTKMVRSAERARCRELVANTAVALVQLYQNEGAWPRALIKNNNKDGGLDERAALPLAGIMTLTSNGSKLVGYNRFGIVSPWAMAVIRRKGESASLSTKVPSGGTIKDHVLRYALDLDGDGIIEDVDVGGETVNVRANAVVWCCGKDGKIEAYRTGLKKDDCHSWTVGQTKYVK